MTKTEAALPQCFGHFLYILTHAFLYVNNITKNFVKIYAQSIFYEIFFKTVNNRLTFVEIYAKIVYTFL